MTLFYSISLIFIYISYEIIKICNYLIHRSDIYETINR